MIILDKLLHMDSSLYRKCLIDILNLKNVEFFAFPRIDVLSGERLIEKIYFSIYNNDDLNELRKKESFGNEYIVRFNNILDKKDKTKAPTVEIKSITVRRIFDTSDILARMHEYTHVNGMYCSSARELNYVELIPIFVELIVSNLCEESGYTGTIQGNNINRKEDCYYAIRENFKQNNLKRKGISLISFPYFVDLNEHIIGTILAYYLHEIYKNDPEVLKRALQVKTSEAMEKFIDDYQLRLDTRKVYEPFYNKLKI